MAGKAGGAKGQARSTSKKGGEIKEKGGEASITFKFDSEDETRKVAAKMSTRSKSKAAALAED